MRRLPRGSHLKCLTAFVEYHVVEGDARVGQRFAQQLTGRTDERLAGLVLHVARLFADEHEPRFLAPIAEHGLRPQPPEITAAATHGLRPRLGERVRTRRDGWARWNRSPGRHAHGWCKEMTNRGSEAGP